MKISDLEPKKPSINRHGTDRAVAAMIWCGDKLVLTKRRKTKTFSGWYAAVGGSVEEGECAIRAIQRETHEETGVYIPRDDFKLIDCYQEDGFKCFIFHVDFPAYRFIDLKNTEPIKHGPWRLYTAQEALKLPKLMPSLEEILNRKLDKQPNP